MRNVNTGRKCEAEKGKWDRLFVSKKRGKSKHGPSTLLLHVKLKYFKVIKSLLMLRVCSQLVLQGKKEAEGE